VNNFFNNNFNYTDHAKHMTVTGFHQTLKPAREPAFGATGPGRLRFPPAYFGNSTICVCSVWLSSLPASS
jgi:hypothetical protein